MIHFTDTTYLEMNEVCELIQRKRLTLWRWMKNKDFPIHVVKIGKKYLFPLQEVEEYKKTLQPII